MSRSLKRVVLVLEALDREYPGAGSTLEYVNPFQLLVATILAAQCTDARVNIVTKEIFRKYPDPKSFAGADLGELMEDIKSTGFYRNKAKNIKASSRLIYEEYGGVVPNSMDELISLPGVARKTANIVLTSGFGKVEGIAIDTHAKRLSYRLGWTCENDPVKIEQGLMNLVPRKWWGEVNHILVAHGRAVCKARKPDCGGCVVEKFCPKAGL
ncbi:MAG: endonuclease III [Candidatus Altiarchaeales archaeon]|nr:endonuclease III [Candidatus Altiarchaeales archaeon]